MRVIAGKFRSRRLFSLQGRSTRPMLGRMRQRLFDILQGTVEGCVFADLYAGTGSVGIEALSRGAARVVFVESNARAAAVIRRNLAALGVQDQALVRVARVREVVRRIPADIYFLGPPYEATREYSTALTALSKGPAQWLIAQHGKQLELRERYGEFSRVRVVKIGANRLSMFQRSSLES